MNHTEISRVQHSLAASRHTNPRSCTQTKHTHAHTNITHTRIVLCKPLRPSLLSRSRPHVCARTRYRYARSWAKEHRVYWTAGHVPEWTNDFEVRLRKMTCNLLVSNPLPTRFILSGYWVQCHQTTLSHTDTHTQWGCSSDTHVL
jgi:hypothetical protein